MNDLIGSLRHKIKVLGDIFGARITAPVVYVYAPMGASAYDDTGTLGGELR